MVAAIDQLPIGWLTGVVKLKGGQNEYRRRVGSWRIRFIADKATKTITVVLVAQRKDAYRP